MDVERREAKLGRAPSHDIASRSDEAAENQIAAFIERRHARRVAEEGERAKEEAWRETTRVYNEKRHLQNRYEWHIFHTAQAERHSRTLEQLISHHEEWAQELMTPRPDDAA